MIWDNRATMHRARPFDDATYRRELRRVTTLDIERPPARREAPDETGPAAASAPVRAPRLMRTSYSPRNRRRILCVSPRYAPSFGTFHHSYPFFGGRVRAFMPPQGLLVIAAYLPGAWEIRFVDENIAPARRGLPLGRRRASSPACTCSARIIADIIRRAHRSARSVVLGGPSVSGCPEYYPEADLLHVGELGDATDAIIADLDVRRPAGQRLRFDHRRGLPLGDFPLPAYDLIALRQYFIASIQFSSGCPYTCEFCDIPALYGRNPRLKTPRRSWPSWT